MEEGILPHGSFGFMTLADMTAFSFLWLFFFFFALWRGIYSFVASLACYFTLFTSVDKDASLTPVRGSLLLKTWTYST